MLVHIGVFLIAVGFAVISIFIAKLLWQTSKTAVSAGEAVAAMEGKIGGTLTEVEHTLAEADITVSDIDTKIHAMQPVFRTAENTGDLLLTVSRELEQLTGQYRQNRAVGMEKKFVRTIQWAEYGFSIWNACKRGKKEGR